MEGGGLKKRLDGNWVAKNPIIIPQTMAKKKGGGAAHPKRMVGLETPDMIFITAASHRYLCPDWPGRAHDGKELGKALAGTVRGRGPSGLGADGHGEEGGDGGDEEHGPHGPLPPPRQRVLLG